MAFAQDFLFIHMVIHQIYSYSYGDPPDLFLFIWWSTRFILIHMVIHQIYSYLYGDPPDLI